MPDSLMKRTCHMETEVLSGNSDTGVKAVTLRIARNGRKDTDQPSVLKKAERSKERSRLGDWEADTVAGKTGKACLVTLADRKSRFLPGGKSAARKADPVNEVIIRSLKVQFLESITPDRGKEFAKHDLVTEELDQVQFYFPLPHHPWQRGTSENTNGLLREYFPKGQDLTDISEEYIQSVFDKLNKRPRKCLGYRTPFEVHYSTLLRLA